MVLERFRNATSYPKTVMLNLFHSYPKLKTNIKTSSSRALLKGGRRDPVFDFTGLRRRNSVPSRNDGGGLIWTFVNLFQHLKRSRNILAKAGIRMTTPGGLIQSFKRDLFFSLYLLNIKEKLLRLFCVLMTIGLVSCTVEELPELSIESVSIYAEPDANQNSAIAVDLVMVYNLELLKTIGQMSAAKYFASARQLLLDNPSLLDIWHWELVPGQMVAGFVPEQDKGDAYGAYVFANYLTPGDHRVKVGPDGIVNILLLRDDLRNLAMSNTHDIKLGTTMSTMTYAQNMCGYNGIGGCGSGCQEQGNTVGLAYTQLGPCQGQTPTCQRRALPPCPIEPPCTRPSQPVQIITKPLNPPVMISPQPYGQ